MQKRLVGPVIGLVAVGLAMGIAHLAAALSRPETSPLVAVGAAVIDLTPQPVESWAIRTFGTYDKLVLLAGMGAALAAVSVAAGVAARRRPGYGLAVIALMGMAGAAAALSRPDAALAAALPSLLGGGGGMAALGLLAGRARPAGAAGEAAADRSIGPNRRSFVVTAAALGAAALLSGSAGVLLVNRRVEASRSSRASVVLPGPAVPAPAVPAGAELDLPGLTPFRTGNEEFYRVDVNLVVPRIDPAGWRLKVHGLVDRELQLDLDGLLGRDLIERDITLACVSNEIGGTYSGNARWIGVPLRELLDEAGVRPEATQLVSRASDGFTIGTPVATVMDGRDSMLVLGMNGEPLPLEHGFPARLLVPGLFGYVSATKWLVDLELTTFEDFDPYWVRRGWDREAPIKTFSRIDTPQPLSRSAPGRVAVAGIAYAPHRGIRRVEVRVDGGSWNPARLAEAPTDDTWRQWLWEWDATPGRHELQVRATDGTGATQPEERVPPFPGGATGWHSIVVRVM